MGQMQEFPTAPVLAPAPSAAAAGLGGGVISGLSSDASAIVRVSRVSRYDASAPRGGSRWRDFDVTAGKKSPFFLSAIEGRWRRLVCLVRASVGQEHIMPFENASG